MNSSHIHITLLMAGLATVASCKKDAQEKPAATEATDKPAPTENVKAAVPPAVPPATIDAAPAKAAETKSCVGGGTATVAGTIKETDLAVLKSAWFFEPMPGMIGIAMQQEGKTCATEDALTVALILCSRDAQSYTVTAAPDDGPNCEANPTTAYALAEGSDGIDLGLATGGTITIEHGGTDCLAGKFDVEIDKTPVTGTFEATFCKDMAVPPKPE